MSGKGARFRYRPVRHIFPFPAGYPVSQWRPYSIEQFPPLDELGQSGTQSGNFSQGRLRHIPEEHFYLLDEILDKIYRKHRSSFTEMVHCDSAVKNLVMGYHLSEWSEIESSGFGSVKLGTFPFL